MAQARQRHEKRTCPSGGTPLFGDAPALGVLGDPEDLARGRRRLLHLGVLSPRWSRMRRMAMASLTKATMLMG
jgi:hypothetical protein